MSALGPARTSSGESLLRNPALQRPEPGSCPWPLDQQLSSGLGRRLDTTSVFGKARGVALGPLQDLLGGAPCGKRHRTASRTSQVLRSHNADRHSPPSPSHIIDCLLSHQHTPAKTSGPRSDASDGLTAHRVPRTRRRCHGPSVDAVQLGICIVVGIGLLASGEPRHPPRATNPRSRSVTP